MKEDIRKRLLETGAVAVGFAKAGEIDSMVHEAYSKWIGEGWHGDMSYLERHSFLRKHTDNVLPESRTVISLAYNYAPEEWRDEKLPYISSYAYGRDYHIAFRELLKPVVEEFREFYGGKWRICIDSAPVAERYWAIRSGIGIIGKNCAVIIPDHGALCFLVEILTTVEIPPDKAILERCEGCDACLKVCPSGALKGDGTMDARRCINYLTIEKKDEFSEDDKKILKSGVGYLFGCDKCLRICPHNRRKDKVENNNIKEDKTNSLNYFQLSEEIRNLTPGILLSMQTNEFNQRFKDSPLAYATLKRLISTSILLK